MRATTPAGFLAQVIHARRTFCSQTNWGRRIGVLYRGDRGPLVTHADHTFPLVLRAGVSGCRGIEGVRCGSKWCGVENEAVPGRLVASAHCADVLDMKLAAERLGR
jgi:hypothetical protein